MCDVALNWFTEAQSLGQHRQCLGFTSGHYRDGSVVLGACKRLMYVHVAVVCSPGIIIIALPLAPKVVLCDNGIASAAVYPLKLVATLWGDMTHVT